MAQWRIYYGDGSTFSDEDGSPEQAPAVNVQVIAQAADPGIGRRTCARYDFFWFDNGEWHGSDLFGLFDFLMRSSVVKFGRVVPRLEFEALLNRAVTDPDIAPKVAWDTHERR
jgi:hypothetical protein